MEIIRRKTKVIRVGDVLIGGDNPISVQSMTNTLTTDVEATSKQINDCADAGADIMRVSCPNKESSLALKSIVDNVNIPVIADIHYDYRCGLVAGDNGADCLRINPGNIGSEKGVQEIVSCPTCSRKGVDVIKLATELERRTLDIEKHIKVCVMGCVVNGLGESQKAECGIVGLSLDKNLCALYNNGQKIKNISNDEALDELEKLIRNKV